MGLPSVTIAFRTTAASAVTRSQKGTLAVILKDDAVTGPVTMTGATQIPADLSAENRDYLKRAFIGYVTPPRKVMAYVLPAAAGDMNEALDWLATQVFDYLAGPPDLTPSEGAEIVSWIKSRRLNDNAICKAVLPAQAADNEAVINFTSDAIKAGEVIYSTAEYCSRIAGLIAGTPMTISCTYAPLPEVSDLERMTKEEMDAAVDAGEFILLHDGAKVKVGRGVNSLITTTQDKGAIFKKIKMVEIMDMIQSDIRITADDSWIGKYANSYDNKCLLITAIKGYLVTLEIEGILQEGSSAVEIDLEMQEAYLMSKGIDTASMSEQQLKEANTDDQVFLAIRTKPMDAIEDMAIRITL